MSCLYCISMQWKRAYLHSLTSKDFVCSFTFWMVTALFGLKWLDWEVSFWMYSSFVLWTLEKSSSSAWWRERRVSRAVASSLAFSWSAVWRMARVAFWASDKEGRERTHVFCWNWEGLRPACVEGSSTGVGDGEREAMRSDRDSRMSSPQP